MASSNTGDRLYPYENKNWAMLVQADPDHPLEPGTEDGGLVILIQNIGGTARKLNSYIGLTYRVSNTPGQIVFTTPWEKADELNMDTAVGGTFAPDGLPGDKVFLTITPPVTGGSKVEAQISSIEQDRRVWSFLPKDGWKDGTEYTVTAWSELEGRLSAPTSRKFKAVAPKPSVNILTPAKDGVALSPRTRLTGSYGGIVKKADGITLTHNGTSLVVRQDDPVKGTWSADPPSGGWEIGDDHHIVAQAQNESEKSEELKRSFTVCQLKPGKPRITTPPKPVAKYYSMFKPPHLAGVVEPWMQLGSVQGPCDRVTVSDPAQPEQTMTAQLAYDQKLDTYTWSLETDWASSDAGVRHDIQVTAWLGDEHSEPDEKSTVGFLMKTPAPEENPIQFTSPKRDDPEADPKSEIAGSALRDTPQVTISERGTKTTDELPVVVPTTTDEHGTHWSWKPSAEWTKTLHTVVVTASRPNQMNEISFTVPGPPTITVSQPAEGKTIYSHDSIDGRLPKDAVTETVTIEDTCGGTTLPFTAENPQDRTFHYAPPPTGDGWRTGAHSVVVKAGKYTSDPRHFTVAGKKVVFITSKTLLKAGTITFEIPDAWNKLAISWSDGTHTEPVPVVTATSEELKGEKPSQYPNWPFSVYSPPPGYWKTGTYTLQCWNKAGVLLGEDSKAFTVA
ncbi:hypothetical protein OG413_25200 [Streptomyces sp. NBC_01433]|uniref:hypothetical protein n=1 Tax=Streptomyces sp. NBC_01433 TaxID=2903864 RepID=UPI002255DBAB|nr:hypothetical protein [Streptomyces sp. NBC_01433]MCX4678564.1 hypothetical protein [Streptomyces sp. NBC_01433]